MSAENQNSESRYLGFSLGPEEFAIPLLSVKEVIAVPEITPIPHTPAYFKGIMNLRGQVISIIDLRLKLGIKSTSTKECAVIICDLHGLSIGAIVDSINQVIAPLASEVSERPLIHGQVPSDYITSIYRKNDKLVLFLDLAKSLNVDDRQLINKTQLAKAS